MNGCLARDKDGSLCFYHYEPYKSEAGFWKCNEDEIAAILISEYEETHETRKVSWDGECATPVNVKFELLNNN